MKKQNILIVDDELSMREFLTLMLTKEGYSVDTAENGAEGIKKIEKNSYQLVITDVKMPKKSGIDVLKAVKQNSPETIVIMITAYSSVDSAIEAMKIGAYDYIPKPFKIEEIKIVIRNALEKRELQKENILLKSELLERYKIENLIGNSASMVKIATLIRQVAKVSTNILILGESGTGKEVVARAIHFNSDRMGKPFVTINCGAIPENLLESELFGHKKGAFTGAIDNKEGLFEVADGGTIFLDEIGELPLNIQVKLLRAIQEKEFKRVGDTKDVKVNVKIIAASNRNLEEDVKSNKFREDLYYRLNVIRINMPTLRERKDDIPLLVLHFIDKYNKELNKKVTGISKEAEQCLIKYDYPGNVRELENIIERAIALESGDEITKDVLPELTSAFCSEEDSAVTGINLTKSGLDLEELVGKIEKKLIHNALELCKNNKTEAAKLLKITFRSLRYRLDKYGIE
jgi:two-component system response regulator PilR (NtrC family)